MRPKRWKTCEGVLVVSRRGALDQPPIRRKIFDGGKTADVNDFVENGQPEIFANPRYR